MAVKADNSKEQTPVGGAWQLWQYVIFALAAAIVAITAFLGYIVYMAISGNLIAGAILLIIGVLVVGLAFAFIVWATMWVNQRQDERAGAQMIKVMQYSQLSQGQEWQEKMQALMSGYNAAQAKAKADQQQLKLQEMIDKRPQLVDRTQRASDDNYLEIDDIEVDI